MSLAQANIHHVDEQMKTKVLNHCIDKGNLNANLVQLLIDNKAEVDNPDTTGFTPLLNAVL